MTTRGQNLRSSTPGQVPPAGTRQPGEIWMTFPDIQLGYIDAGRNAQKLIAVRFFSTLANYATGDFVIQAGKLYFAKGAVTAGAFNAGQWTQIAALTDIPALYVLPTASTSVLGGVKIDGTTITINSGVISSAGLVTVSAVAPSPVQNGALWFDLAGGQLYAWVNDGTSSQWVVAVNQSLGGVYLPMTGGVLTGPLTLAGDPVNPLDAATKRYADAPPMGVTNGSDATAGAIGEVMSAVNTTGTGSLTSAVPTNVTAITLTPGDWDVTGEVLLTASGLVVISYHAALNPVSATLPGNEALNTARTTYNGPGVGTQSIPIAPCRVSVSATTNYYLIAFAQFASGTASATGKIWARRAR